MVEMTVTKLTDVAKIISNPFLTKRGSASSRVHSKTQPEVSPYSIYIDKGLGGPLDICFHRGADIYLKKTLLEAQAVSVALRPLQNLYRY